MTKEKPYNYHKKKVRIGRYKVTTMKIGNMYTAHMPMGNNPKDRALFDKLVYYNQRKLYAKTRAGVVNQIKKFIKETRK